MRSGLAPRADCPPGVTEKENELEGPVFVRTDKWHAEYMQINMQIDTFYGLPKHLWHTNTSTLTQTHKLWPKDYCHMPFS